MTDRRPTRRRFLRLAGAGALATGGAASAIADDEAATARAAARYDVIVCGGGTSGLPAAIMAYASTLSEAK